MNGIALAALAGCRTSESVLTVHSQRTERLLTKEKNGILKYAFRHCSGREI